MPIRLARPADKARSSSAPAGFGTRRRTSPPSTRSPPRLPGRCRSPGDWRRPDGSGERPTPRSALGVEPSDELVRLAWRRAAIFALPARYEPFGLRSSRRRCPAAPWCWATSRACASSGPMPRVFVPPDDHEALSRALQTPDRATGASAQLLWRRAHARARSSTAPTRMVERYLDVYADLLDASRTGHAKSPRSRGKLIFEPCGPCVRLFTHSLVSDWNHGNAHFLRGIVARAARRAATRSRLFEPRDGWSLPEPDRRAGARAAAALRRALIPAALDHATTGDAGSRRGARRRRSGARARMERPRAGRAPRPQRADGGRFPLLFHDTHHRSVTEPEAMAALRPVGLRRRAGVRRRDPRPLSRARAGRGAPGPGTRRPTPRCSARCRASRAKATSSGSAIGATTSARPSCASSCSSRCAQLGLQGARPRRALSGGSAARRWPTPASTTAAGCPTTEAPAASSRRSRDGPRAAPALRRGAARHPDHPRRSRRWPAASRWSASPWDDAEGLFRPGSDYLVARDGDEMKRICARAATTATRRGLAAQRARRPSRRATPAPIGSTSCSHLSRARRPPAAGAR